MAMTWTEEGTSRHATVDGHRMRYHDVGSGPVVVMLHGSAPGACGWMSWSENLDALAAHCRVVIVDLLGYGDSDKPPIEGGYIAFHTRAVRGLLDELGIHRAAFVGLSLGGGITLRLAVETPELVERMVLISPFGAHKSSSGRDGVRTRLARAADEPTRERIEEFIQRFVYRKELITPELVDDRFRRFDDPAAIAAVRNTADHYGDLTPEQSRDLELWRELERVHQPVLLICGREDSVRSPASTLEVAQQLPDARLLVLAGAGHWPQFEQAEEFNDHTTAFLTRKPRAHLTADAS